MLDLEKFDKFLHTSFYRKTTLRKYADEIINPYRPYGAKGMAFNLTGVYRGDDIVKVDSIDVEFQYSDSKSKKRQQLVLRFSRSLEDSTKARITVLLDKLNRDNPDVEEFYKNTVTVFDKVLGNMYIRMNSCQIKSPYILGK